MLPKSILVIKDPIRFIDLTLNWRWYHNVVLTKAEACKESKTVWDSGLHEFLLDSGFLVSGTLITDSNRL